MAEEGVVLRQGDTGTLGKEVASLLLGTPLGNPIRIGQGEQATAGSNRSLLLSWHSPNQVAQLRGGAVDGGQSPPVHAARAPVFLEGLQGEQA